MPKKRNHNRLSRVPKKRNHSQLSLVPKKRNHSRLLRVHKTRNRKLLLQMLRQHNLNQPLRALKLLQYKEYQIKRRNHKLVLPMLKLVNKQLLLTLNLFHQGQNVQFINGQAVVVPAQPSAFATTFKNYWTWLLNAWRRPADMTDYGKHNGWLNYIFLSLFTGLCLLAILSAMARKFIASCINNKRIV